MCITTHNTIELYPTCLSKLYIYIPIKQTHQEHLNTGVGPQAVGGAELGGLVSCEGRMVTRVSRGGGFLLRPLLEI